jgi:betaine reductase
MSGDTPDGLFPIIESVGMHKIGAGSTPQAVISSLVADPIKRHGLSFTDIDYYAPELHNPEITELAGAGNVTLSNLKMIAAMAVMEKQIERTAMDSFIETRGSSGWAPTQGHIPSGIPAVGWLLEWGRTGSVKRSLVIGKGSLFLGRMTNLFDGVSIILEYRAAAAQPSASAREMGSAETRADAPVHAPSRGSGGTRRSDRIRLGLLVSGSERGEDEIRKGAEEAMKADPALEILFCGSRGTEQTGKAELDQAFASGSVDGALAFHYPFPVGTATSAPCVYQASGKPFFLATTTGTSAPERVAALVLNGIQGTAAAKAAGITLPSVGFLNLDDARKALAVFTELVRNGYGASVTGSVRGDELLRGNDLLRGNADVIVCDTLTGNLIVKLFGSASTRGEVEDAGSGYGVGIGKTDRAVAIVSRASSAGVVAAALRGDGPDGARERSRRLRRRTRGGRGRGIIRSARGRNRRNGGKTGHGLRRKTACVKREKNAPRGPRKKPVTKEIAGIDILLLEEAAARLIECGLYCEAGMGCTGPVLLVAPEDERRRGNT